MISHVSFEEFRSTSLSPASTVVLAPSVLDATLTSKPVKVRPMRSREVGLCTALHGRGAMALRPAHFLHCLTASQHFAMVAVDQDDPDRIIGCITARNEPCGGHILTLMVHTNFRRRGVGRSLVDASFEKKTGANYTGRISCNDNARKPVADHLVSRGGQRECPRSTLLRTTRIPDGSGASAPGLLWAGRIGGRRLGLTVCRIGTLTQW